MVSMHEESSPSPQLLPTPQCVGREFVRQYYTLLAEAPRYVHRFYSNESIFVHGSDTEEIVGQTAIQNKIKDLSFEECRTRIRALDAHETLGKGVVVQVVGEISVNGGPMRRFVQTFVLAPQSEKKYYVHNDIFRYEDELFLEKLAQENGAPADPEAETTTCLDDGRRRVGSLIDQSTLNNGNTHHPDEIENVRYNIPPPIAAQQHPIQMPALSQPQNQPLPNQLGPGSGYPGTPATVAVGLVNLPHQIPDGAAASVADDGDAAFASVHPTSATSATPVSVQQPAVPAVIPYGQQAPLPQRTQPQQSVHPPSAHPAPTVITAASMPSAQSEPLSTPGSAAATEHPQRPPSADKTSPTPSEEREEAVETGSADKTWANVAKQKSNRSPQQFPIQQQQSQHALAAAGTSAPAMVSPTGMQAPHFGQTELPTNKFPSQLHQHQAGRHVHSHRQPRPINVHGGGVSQDARSSPAPSGHQPNFPGGANRAGSASGGPSDLLPNDQQIYVKNLPQDTTEEALKDFFEGQGYTGILETRVRRKAMNAQHSVFAFMTFDSADTALKLIQKKNFAFRGVEITIDERRIIDKNSGGNAGNYPYNGGSRAFGGPGMAGSGRGNMNQGRGMMARAPNRPSVPSGMYGGQGGGGGNRQPGRVYSNSAGRGGGGNSAHPQ